MNVKAFLVKYGEIGVKGKNRNIFEDALVKQIRMHLHAAEGQYQVIKQQGRIYVEAQDFDYDEAVNALQHVFGIIKICPVVQVEDNGPDQLKADVVAYMKDTYPSDQPMTFKVETRRLKKSFPVDSQQMNKDLGEVVLNECPNFKVDVHNPNVLVRVEIRNEIINIYSKEIEGAGGMPLGTNGKAMLLLSGGIDSPVAGYMIAKRGVKLEAVYFSAPPYTSERATQKVIDLAKLVAKYSGPIHLHIVNFTDIQLAIYEKCPHDELTIIMRRYMMRIAQAIAEKEECIGLITGESIGQVASQTMQSMAVTNQVASMAVYRPLIGFDKEEIVTLSKKINTYETSILPYEDCCTIFVAKHPVTKPILEKIQKSEIALADVDAALMQQALDSVESVWCGARDSQD